MEKFDLITFRPHNYADLDFIYATWLRGLRFGNIQFLAIEEKTYMDNQRNKIKDILDTATINIACLKEDNDVILGYSVNTNETIDWVFVKPAWRQIKLTHGLLKHITPKRVSHVTYVGNALREKYKLTFNPF